MAETLTRAERKQRTHQALLDAALEHLRDSSLSSLSLREVSRSAGVVPTAFYRHFESMDDLGVALVERSTRPLRQMLRDARRHPTSDPITGSVAILHRQVRSNEEHFRFMLRERCGGVTDVRRAIQADLHLFTTELAADLAAMPVWADHAIRGDIALAADLMVSAMLTTVQELLDVGPEAEDLVLRKAELQLRMIVTGMFHWRV